MLYPWAPVDGDENVQEMLFKFRTNGPIILKIRVVKNDKGNWDVLIRDGENVLLTEYPSNTNNQSNAMQIAFGLALNEIVTAYKPELIERLEALDDIMVTQDSSRREI